MKDLLNAAEMKAVDQRSIEEYGIPSLVLMERAALEVVKRARELLEPGLSGNEALEHGPGGRVDVTDCVLLNKAVAGSVQLDTAANKNADCNGNGEISSDDATVLMQFIVNLVKTLPYNG